MSAVHLTIDQRKLCAITENLQARRCLRRHPRMVRGCLKCFPVSPTKKRFAGWEQEHGTLPVKTGFGAELSLGNAPLKLAKSKVRRFHRQTTSQARVDYGLPQPRSHKGQRSGPVSVLKALILLRYYASRLAISPDPSLCIWAEAPGGPSPDWSITLGPRYSPSSSGGCSWPPLQ